MVDNSPESDAERVRNTPAIKNLPKLVGLAPCPDCGDTWGDCPCTEEFDIGE